jgi:hypothetical protein
MVAALSISLLLVVAGQVQKLVAAAVLAVIVVLFRASYQVAIRRPNQFCL